MNRTKSKPKRIGFTLLNPQAASVLLAGDFNDWDTASLPMKKDKKGTWRISLHLDPGTYQYNFYVDGEWKNDPNCTELVPNPFGTFNSVKRVE